ncbi:hypothetical protein [Streptomyces sp. NBC_00564]|uniref:hypothetical protein n=1 Tax=Streptomyces sp. NBC_00564 TaxID=2903663 RepID=UPI002FCD9559|nr:hypothetical protein OG256_44685 [Streptomyces sp. NBC_00564]
MDRIEQLPLDDWNDQDLLTRDEAGERLQQEIQVVTGELAQLRRGAPDRNTTAGVELLDKRLTAMKAALSELTGG